MTDVVERRASGQLAFLRNLQCLLDEGQFVASYKYALLMSIAELCLERDTESDGSLKLPLSDIAARFIEIYWPQVAPFRGSEFLHQNMGRPAAILNRIAEAKGAHATLAKAKRSRQWEPLVSRVSKHLEQMPLWRLQVVGGQTKPFLYEHQLVYGSIVLNPGVARAFCDLNGVVLALVQMAWIRYLHRVPANRTIIGPESDLATFLFGSERNVLTSLRPPLMDIQSGRCFYCPKRLEEGGSIDHFIPWSRYARDLGHNFVLAHSKCNGSKSDLLADVPHLEAWIERNERDRAVLGKIFESLMVLHDEPTSRRVASWAYESTAAAGGLVWRAGEGPRPLGSGWREFFK